MDVYLLLKQNKLVKNKSDFALNWCEYKQPRIYLHNGKLSFRVLLMIHNKLIAMQKYELAASVMKEIQNKVSEEK